MTIKDKYEKIITMRSIATFTAGKYPTLKEFRKALREGRVCGYYDRKIVIVSNNLNDNYTFVRE